MRRWIALAVVCFLLSFVSIFALSFVNIVVAFVGFGVFAIVGALVLLITSSKVNTGNAHLLNVEGARHGRATILSAEPTMLFLRTGEVEYPPQMHRLRLRIELPRTASYEIGHAQGVQPWRSALFTPGREVPCLVHPRRRSVVHLLVDDQVSVGSALPAAALGSSPSVASVSHRDGTAVVHAVRDLGPSPTGRHAVELDLLVAVAGEAPYRVVTTAERPLGQLPRLGETLRILVDPSLPSAVLLVD